MGVESHHEVWGEEAPATEPGTPEPSGEVTLAAAVLKLAFEDLQKHRHATETRRRRAFRDAYVWVTSDERSWPFSFLNVCDVLDLSAATLRAKLLAES